MPQRLAVATDVPAIQHICRQHRAAFGFLQRPVLEDAAARQAEGDRRHLLIVETDAGDTPIGFVRLYQRRDRITKLHEIGVHRDRLGQGVGSALMRRAIDEARASDQDTLELSVPSERPTNAWSPRFGFEHVGTRPARVRTLNSYRLELRTPEDMLEELVERHEQYLHGNCHLFAVALHRLTGLPIEAALDTDLMTGRNVLMHAYLRDGDRILDLAGRRDWEVMLQSFDAFRPTRVAMTPRQLLGWGEPRPDSKRVDRDIARAAIVARRVLDQVDRPEPTRQAA